MVQGGILLVLGAAIASFVGALNWTAPGPDQRSHRQTLAVGVALFSLTILGMGIAAGIAEGRLATPETDAAEFGVGYLFGALTLTLPLIIYDLALAGLVFNARGSTGARVASAIALGIFAGIPAWLCLIAVMSWFEDAFHP